MDYGDKLPPSPQYIFTPPRRYIFTPPLTQKRGYPIILDVGLDNVQSVDLRFGTLWPEVPFRPWKAYCTWGCDVSPEGPKRSVGAAERLSRTF